MAVSDLGSGSPSGKTQAACDWGNLGHASGGLELTRLTGYNMDNVESREISLLTGMRTSAIGSLQNGRYIDRGGFGPGNCCLETGLAGTGKPHAFETSSWATSDTHDGAGSDMRNTPSMAHHSRQDRLRIAPEAVRPRP